jgi:diketogulonate reductase-like aldo/keto reductase
VNDQDRCILSSVDVRMPRIIYGTAWKKERTAGLVAQALTAGFRGIDTACQPKHYNEPGVGQGLAQAYNQTMTRSDVYLQTKFTPLAGQDPQRIPYDPAVSLTEQVQQSVRASLHNLQTDYCDGYLLHSPMEREHDLQEVWRAMELLVVDKCVRQIGISNCYDPAVLRRLYQWAEVKPAIVQNRFYDQTGYDREIRSFCREQGIVYQGFWTLTANPHVLAHDIILKLAGHYKYTPSQIWVRYMTQMDIMPLIGTTSAEHMKEDLAIFDFMLTPGECVSIGDILDV